MIFLHITNLCNYNCKYCSEGLPYRKNEDKWNISLDIVKYVSYMITQYLSTFNIYICLIGGEPLLHPQLFEIIQIFEKNKHVKGLYLLTNNSIDVKNIFMYKIKIPIYFSFSLHTDEMKRIGYEKQFEIFVANVKYLLQICENSHYVIEILHNMLLSKDYHLQIQKHLADIFDKKSVYMIPIHSTKWFNSCTDNTHFINPMYGKSVAVNSYAIITKNTEMNVYHISNTCEMVNHITSIYDISFWKKMAKIYFIRKICNKKICLCRLCLIFKQFDIKLP